MKLIHSPIKKSREWGYSNGAIERGLLGYEAREPLSYFILISLSLKRDWEVILFGSKKDLGAILIFLFSSYNTKIIHIFNFKGISSKFSNFWWFSYYHNLNLCKNIEENDVPSPLFKEISRMKYITKTRFYSIYTRNLTCKLTPYQKYSKRNLGNIH